MAQSDPNDYHTHEPESDLRTSFRDAEVCDGVSSFAYLRDGTVLEGVVRDVSDGGACISGEITGLTSGDQIELEFVIRDEKIRYLALIKHITHDENLYGLKFLAGPSNVTVVDPTRRKCIKCNELYEPPWRFCGICGSELTQPRTK